MTSSTTRSFILAWVAALLFYVLEYAARSSPAVMIPQLSTAFSTSTVGVGAILGAYYTTYSVASLAAGAALDRFGARIAVSFGVLVLAIGCLVFTIADASAGYAGRLLQGLGSSFAFTGAVYLASRGFASRSLATAIGVTQCMGMLGGSAGQFLVGPLIAHGMDWTACWIFFGIVGIVLAALLFAVTPSNDATPPAGGASAGSWLRPYSVVLANPQSWLCGLIAGLLFLPTTIGDMTWGVAFFQHDEQMSFSSSVATVSMVPLGWVVGCPLMGWLADLLAARKPVLVGGALAMLALAAQIALMPQLMPPMASLFLFGVASGVAMIPYTIIKESNPDEVKGCATGIQNFLVFGLSALVGPVFGHLLGKTLETTTDKLAHFQHAGYFWMAAIAVAIVASLLLRETGRGRPAALPGDRAAVPARS